MKYDSLQSSKAIHTPSTAPKYLSKLSAWTPISNSWQFLQNYQTQTTETTSRSTASEIIPWFQRHHFQGHKSHPRSTYSSRVVCHPLKQSKCISEHRV